MKTSGKQTKIPFSERKLIVKTKCTTPKKIESSGDENSPLKYKLVVSSESKIILRRSSSACSEKTSRTSSDHLSYRDGECLRRTPKRGTVQNDLFSSGESDDCPTPSKRKYCCKKNDDQYTPEKHDFSTPSSMLSRLQLKSTENSNKQHDSNQCEGNLKPRELFPSISNARKALYSSSSSLPCREDEINKLFQLLNDHLENKTCGSIYIAGLPGTGKSATVDYVIQNPKFIKGYNIVKINCTSVSSSAAVYKRIHHELKIKNSQTTERDSKVLIEQYLLRKHKMILLILDEIDQLETRSQSVLYQIFEWPSWKKAKLVLIGIANAMDLTDRILPRLCAKVELKPILLHFAPYSKDQIKKILSHRLTEVGANYIFTPSAIELISAKVAGLSGDVRRALDLGRRVVEISEETKAINHEKSPTKKIKQKGINEDLLSDILKLNDRRRSPLKVPSAGKTTPSFFFDQPKKLFDNGEDTGAILKEIKLNEVRKDSPVKHEDYRRSSPRKPCQIISDNAQRSPNKAEFSIDSKDVLNVMKNIYGSSKMLKANNGDSPFPLHQKILLCTFLLITQKGKIKDLNIGKLHQIYKKICFKRGITPVDQSGFLFLCRQLEMRGIMLVGKGQGKLAKISLQWDEEEVTEALKDLNLLSSIMNDVSCL